MYSGENVVVISPDSDVLSILEAAMKDETPDVTLPKHARFSFANGEVRPLVPLIKPSELLVTGQTQQEADTSNRKMRALRVEKKSQVDDAPTDWFDIWEQAVDSRVESL